jgi:hypothetical protein
MHARDETPKRKRNKMRHWLLLMRTLLWVLTLTAFMAEAQSPPPVEGRAASAQTLWLSTGFESTWLLELGYSRLVAQPDPTLSLRLDALLGSPIVLLPHGVDDGLLAAGATALLRLESGLGVTASLLPGLRFSHDVTGTWMGLGAALGLRPGYYAPSWSLSLDLAWDSTLLARKWHSEVARDAFRDRYPEGAASPSSSGPRDGWYALTAWQLRAGLAGAVRLSSAMSLHASGGFLHTPQLAGITSNPPIGPLPFYMYAGGGYQW